MPDSSGTLDSAVAEALAGVDLTQFEDDDEAWEGTSPEPEPVATPDSGSGTPDAAHSDSPVDASSEGQKPTERGAPPKEYFGIRLEGLTDEQAWAIVDQVAERDKVIQRYARDKADLQKQLEESGQSPDVAPTTSTSPTLTDEQILAGLGIAQDDPLFEVKAETVLPLARMVLPLASEVRELREQRELEQVAIEWDTTLTSLETDFGRAYGPDGQPLTHEDIFAFAARNAIQNPEIAYHRLTAGARKATGERVQDTQAAALEALRRQQAGGVRPTTGPASKPTTLTAKTVKEAIAEAAQLAARDTGLSWKDAINQDEGA